MNRIEFDCRFPRKECVIEFAGAKKGRPAAIGFRLFLQFMRRNSPHLRFSRFVSRERRNKARHHALRA